MPECIWNCLHFADLTREGLPPVAGGALDQCHVFLQAARFAWAEEQRWREEMSKW